MKSTSTKTIFAGVHFRGLKYDTFHPFETYSLYKAKSRFENLKGGTMHKACMSPLPQQGSRLASPSGCVVFSLFQTRFQLRAGTPQSHRETASAVRLWPPTNLKTLNNPRVRLFVSTTPGWRKPPGSLHVYGAKSFSAS